MTANFSLTVPLESLVWYDTSPDAGDPACLCSHCGKAILVWEMPIRLYRDLGNDRVLEARFHDVCLGEVSTLKIQPMTRQEYDDLEDYA